jgi:plastocyanin
VAKLFVFVLAALASVSVVFLGLAQEVVQIGVGTPVTWSVDGTPVDSHNVVAILDASFAPVDITIPVGGTVTWKSQSDLDHTVASTPDGGATFNSGGKDFPIEKGQSWSNPFPTAGAFGYRCEIHDEMTGTVHVVEAG